METGILDKTMTFGLRNRNFITNTLQDHTMGFGPHSDSWAGNMAMAVECPGKEIWGAVWRLTPEQWEDLKR